MPAPPSLGVWNAVKFTLSLLLSMLALFAFGSAIWQRNPVAAIGAPVFFLLLAVLPWLPWDRWVVRVRSAILQPWILALAGAVFTALLTWLWLDIVRGDETFPMKCSRRSALLCAVMNELYELAGARAAGLPIIGLIAFSFVCTLVWGCIAWAKRSE